MTITELLRAGGAVMFTGQPVPDHCSVETIATAYRVCDHMSVRDAIIKVEKQGDNSEKTAVLFVHNYARARADARKEVGL